jgi:hypothetical protein
VTKIKDSSFKKHKINGLYPKRELLEFLNPAFTPLIDLTTQKYYIKTPYVWSFEAFTLQVKIQLLACPSMTLGRVFALD